MTKTIIISTEKGKNISLMKRFIFLFKHLFLIMTRISCNYKWLWKQVSIKILKNHESIISMDLYKKLREQSIWEKTLYKNNKK